MNTAASPLPDENHLRTLIRDSFSTEPYYGPVTPADGMEWAEEIDDDLDLWQSLTGKSWTAVPEEFIDRHDGDLVLLTPTAFAAFLPAWLTRALSNDQVREFTIYAFLLHDQIRDSPAFQEHWQTRVRSLHPDQIRCVRQVLSSIRDHDREEWHRRNAAAALETLSL